MIDEKARKASEAYRLGRDCGYRGFSSLQFGARLLKMTKDERKSFDQGLIDGTLEKSRETTIQKNSTRGAHGETQV